MKKTQDKNLSKRLVLKRIIVKDLQDVSGGINFRTNSCPELCTTNGVNAADEVE